MTIYGRFGQEIKILREATLDDVRTFEDREPDDMDENAVELGSYLITLDLECTVEDEEVTGGTERLHSLAFIKADGGINEICAAIEKTKATT